MILIIHSINLYITFDQCVSFSGHWKSHWIIGIHQRIWAKVMFAGQLMIKRVTTATFFILECSYVCILPLSVLRISRLLCMSSLNLRYQAVKAVSPAFWGLFRDTYSDRITNSNSNCDKLPYHIFICDSFKMCDRNIWSVYKHNLISFSLAI